VEIALAMVLLHLAAALSSLEATYLWRSRIQSRARSERRSKICHGNPSLRRFWPTLARSKSTGMVKYLSMYVPACAPVSCDYLSACVPIYQHAYLSVCLPVCFCVCLSVCLSVCCTICAPLVFVCLLVPVCMPVDVPLCETICLSVCLHVCSCIPLFVCVPACLCVCLFRCLSIHLPVYPSVCLCISLSV